MEIFFRLLPIVIFFIFFIIFVRRLKSLKGKLGGKDLSWNELMGQLATQMEKKDREVSEKPVEKAEKAKWLRLIKKEKTYKKTKTFTKANRPEVVWEKRGQRPAPPPVPEKKEPVVPKKPDSLPDKETEVQPKKKDIFSRSDLRKAVVWREILSTPPALKDWRDKDF